MTPAGPIWQPAGVFCLVVRSLFDALPLFPSIGPEMERPTHAITAVCSAIILGWGDTPPRRGSAPCRPAPIYTQGFFWRANFLPNNAGLWYTAPAALLQSGNRKEVSGVEYLCNFLVAVGASVVAYCIRKWLDGHGKGK